LIHSTSPVFHEGFFEIGSHGTICPYWLWTTILLITTSWVARIIGMSHWHLAVVAFLKVWFKLGTSSLCL
jgi:hypothetical protein